MNFRKQVLNFLWSIVKLFGVIIAFIIYLIISLVFVVIAWFIDLALIPIAFMTALVINKYPQFGKFKISLVVVNILSPLGSLIICKKNSRCRNENMSIFKELCREVRENGLFNFEIEN